MKTDAPGKFSCEIYVKAWELGFREGSTKLHIDHCSFCNPIVHGGTEEFPLSAAEQAQQNIAARKLASRRRFFRQAGIPSYGFSPFLIFATDTFRRDTLNERIDIQGFIRGVELYERAVRKLAG